MKFASLFEKYWDNLIIGILAGMVLYYRLKIQNGIIAGLYIFFISIIVIVIYTFFVLIGKKYEWDKKIIHLSKNLNLRKFFLSFPFIAFITGLIILVSMFQFPLIFNYLQLETQDRIQYFNTLVGLLGGLFVLTFSITLISLQISASKFSTIILKRYFKDRAVLASLLFFVFSIIFCLTSYFYFNIFIEEVAFMLVVLGLILVISQFYLVGKYADPIEISKDIITEIKNIKESSEFSDKNKIQKLIELHYIIIKSDDREAREILKMLSNLRRNIVIPRTKYIVNSYIASSGIFFAQTGLDSSLDAIYNLINFEKKEIDELKDEIYTINSAIMQSRSILHEIIKNGKNIELLKISLVQTQLYLLYEILYNINDKNLNVINEHQIKPFLKEFSLELEKLEKIEQRKKIILSEYEKNKGFIESLERERRQKNEK